MTEPQSPRAHARDGGAGFIVANSSIRFMPPIPAAGWSTWTCSPMPESLEPEGAGREPSTYRFSAGDIGDADMGMNSTGKIRSRRLWSIFAADGPMWTAPSRPGESYQDQTCWGPGLLESRASTGKRVRALDYAICRSSTD